MENWKRKKELYRLASAEFRVNKWEASIMIWVEAIALSVVFFSTYVLFQLENLAKQLVSDSESLIFFIDGFASEDERLLSFLGFSQIDFDSGMVATDSLRFIWVKKFIAVLRGGDIWNGYYEEYLGMLFKFEVILSLIVVFVFSLLYISMNNSYAFRLDARKSYSRLLFSLGLSEKEVISVHNFYFLSRNMIGACVSVGLYIGMLFYLRFIINESLNLLLSLDNFRVGLIPMVGIIIIGISSVRRKDVFE